MKKALFISLKKWFFLKDFCCNICNKRVASWSSLQRHIRNHHPHEQTPHKPHLSNSSTTQTQHKQPSFTLSTSRSDQGSKSIKLFACGIVARGGERFVWDSGRRKEEVWSTKCRKLALPDLSHSPGYRKQAPKDSKIASLQYPDTSWEVSAAFSPPLSSSTDEPQHLQRRGLNAIQKRRRWQGKPNLRHESAHLQYPDLWRKENRFRLGVWAGIDWNYNVWKGQWILPEKFGAMLVKVGKKTKNWASCGIVVCARKRIASNLANKHN